MPELTALVGGILTYGSFAGLGLLTRRMFGAVEPINVAEGIAIGLSGTVLIGGFLNLLHTINLATIMAIGAIGLTGAFVLLVGVLAATIYV